jgi:threonine dehydratase
LNGLSEYPQVTRDDVLAASDRVSAAVLRTPLIETEIRGRRLWLKCECLQTGGSFKLRGATNRLALLSAEERERGVVAFSSGNHAQGVAIAAKRLGIRAIIVMPSDAPKLKIEGTRAQGAEITLYDRRSEDRVAIAARIGAETGATVVPSFDDPHIVAGQGTVGLEILDQLAEAGASPPARIVVNCGGGGLSAGIALACPDAEIVPVEPDGWDDMLRSLERARSYRSGPAHRRRCATRSRRRWFRRSPLVFSSGEAPQASPSATRKWPTRFAGHGRSMA